MPTRRHFLINSALAGGALSLHLKGIANNLLIIDTEIIPTSANKITTVTGDILPEKLGFTSIHEHTICDLTLLRNSLGPVPSIPSEMLALNSMNYASLRGGLGLFSDECSTLGDVDYMVKELKAFKAFGGNAVVDASPIGIRGDVMDLKVASEKSGVYIVCATGLYHSSAQPGEFLTKSEPELIKYFEKEIKEGIEGTGVKPGFIKCALHNLNPDNTIHPVELKTFRACAKASASTGYSLHVHVNKPIAGEHILQAIGIATNECGMKAHRLHIMHMDSYLRTPESMIDYYSNIESVRTVSTDLHIKVLETGVSIGFDSWGSLTDYLPDDFDRIKGLVDLIKKGYVSQIALGNDVYDKSRGITHGYTGFTGFIRAAIPALKKLDVGDDAIAKLTVGNPARIMAY